MVCVMVDRKKVWFLPILVPVHCIHNPRKLYQFKVWSTRYCLWKFCEAANFFYFCCTIIILNNLTLGKAWSNVNAQLSRGGGGRIHNWHFRMNAKLWIMNRQSWRWRFTIHISQCTHILTSFHNCQSWGEDSQFTVHANPAPVISIYAVPLSLCETRGCH